MLRNQRARGQGIHEREHGGHAAVVVAQGFEARAPAGHARQIEGLGGALAGQRHGDLAEDRDVRAAKAVDGLLAIAHDGEPALAHVREAGRFAGLAWMFRIFPEQRQELALQG